ncbi:MAG: serine--tRNA ligase [Bacteroidales bacterium]|nr:serine--tRNA ligase [Bacteroidales bacterium]
MLSLQYIRENSEYIIERLKTRNNDYTETIEKLKHLDDERRSTQQKVNTDQSELNTLSKKIGQLFREGKTEEANEAKNRNADLKQKIKENQNRLNEIEEKIRDLLIQVPNIPHPSVIQGKGEEDNQFVRSGGKTPQLGPDALPHWELGKKYDILNFDLGNKITGRGFPVYKDKGSRLQRAMINYFLDKARAEGYQEMLPPLMVNEDSAFATGQLPDKEGQMYAVPVDNFYLIPTAEVPVTNIYRDSILDEKDLPVKMTAYTPCFRREAGSWGKEVRGLNRVHQFDKVEIVQIDHPERSYQTLEEMTSYVESLIKDLELPYRIMRLCGGDLGFAAALTYDFEVYSSAQDKWLEVSSVSNFESYQANRLKLRFRAAGAKKPQPAHTLNGSALALPRLLAALLENNQDEKGIRIPDVLQEYTGFDHITA